MKSLRILGGLIPGAALLYDVLLVNLYLTLPLRLHYYHPLHPGAYHQRWRKPLYADLAKLPIRYFFPGVTPCPNCQTCLPTA
ncbi:hypothetical protein EMIT0P253_10544 [Pseudomonas sp. IT-P253]